MDIRKILIALIAVFTVPPPAITQQTSTAQQT
jgi:hypothetical protein